MQTPQLPKVLGVTLRLVCAQGSRRAGLAAAHGSGTFDDEFNVWNIPLSVVESCEPVRSLLVRDNAPGRDEVGADLSPYRLSVVCVAQPSERHGSCGFFWWSSWVGLRNGELLSLTAIGGAWTFYLVKDTLRGASDADMEAAPEGDVLRVELEQMEQFQLVGGEGWDVVAYPPVTKDENTFLLVGSMSPKETGAPLTLS